MTSVKVMLQIQRNDAKYSVRLADMNLADDGNYTCFVSNELGAISRIFTVNVVGNVDLSVVVCEIRIDFCCGVKPLSVSVAELCSKKSKERRRRTPHKHIRCATFSSKLEVRTPDSCDSPGSAVIRALISVR